MTRTKKKRARRPRAAIEPGPAETQPGLDASPESGTVGEAPLTPPPLPPPDAPTSSDQVHASEAHAAADGDTAEEVTAEEIAAHAATLTPQGLVDLVETANVLGVEMALKRWKVADTTPGVDALQQFSPSTRRRLVALAPAAIPYVQRYLGNSGLVGALLFAGASVWAVAKNMAAVKALAPKAPLREPSPFEPASVPPPPKQTGESYPAGFPTSTSSSTT